MMYKLKDYWRRWCLCYRENGLIFTVKKTFVRIGERRRRIKAEKLALKNGIPVQSASPAPPEKNDTLGLLDTQMNVGLLLKGGLGDIVVLANYIYKFRQKYGYENLRIDVFVHNSYNSAKVVLYDGYIIDHLYPEQGYEHSFREYDVFIDISRYPDVKKRELKKMELMMPELLEYVYLCERFRSENSRFFTYSGITDGQSAMLSIINNKKRIHQPDVYGFLEVQEEYEYDIPVMEDEYEFLADLDLKSRRFITINRGVDTNYTKSSIKLWPQFYYNTLVRLLKKKYPDIVLVQLGSSYDRCQTFEGIDLDLIGKTNLEQVKVLLKHSLVHIDGEGGMVHLRHALKGGRSVVMFGPTSSEFFGYSENENIVGNGCDTWCEWAVNNWQEGCLRGYSNAPCMASIIPEKVMLSVEKIITEEMES